MQKRRHFDKTISLAACIAVLFCVGATFAVPDASADTERIGPSLQIPIPTVKFSDIVTTKETVSEGGTDVEVEVMDVPWLANYLSGVYQYALGLATMIAAVMIMIGGFQYLTAGGDASRVGKAKERIKDAVIGLVLTLFAYVILLTINPDLVALTGLKIRRVERKMFTAEEREDFGDSTSAGGGGGATAVCGTVESCRTLCDNPDSWPTTTPGVMDPSLAVTIPSEMPGVRGNSKKASQAVIDGLRRAGEIAQARGYIISVSSGYRPLRTQIELVCARMGDAEREAGIGTAVAWPGGSNHGAGYAVDLKLLDSDGHVIVGSGDCAGQAAGTLATPANSRIFDEIMTQAGASRYSNEIWHYEFGSSSGCRCSFPGCPSPPISCSGNC